MGQEQSNKEIAVEPAVVKLTDARQVRTVATAAPVIEPTASSPHLNDTTPKSGEALDAEIESKLKELGELRQAYIYPLLFGDGLQIDSDTADDVYESLLEKGNQSQSIEVLINSGGGDIHAAYNLGLLFRRFGTSNLRFIIPRWAKSAATLLVCSGDLIYMGPVAEIGPLDPQITEMNPLERRLEEFSPLHIEATLALIRDEFSNGHAKLASGLLQRFAYLLEHLHAETGQRKISSSPVLRWERYIRLKNGPDQAREAS